MRSTNRFITLLLFGLASVIGITGQVMAEDGSTQRAVLVTGASSGIGKKVTELLAAKGHFVYAGARKDDDLAALDKLDNVKAVRLDVTKQSDIDAAVELIGKEGRGLYGIVNNAGVAVVSPMNETPEKDIDFVFDVNIYGPYRINKAFAPMLVEAGGRTTTIGSISGFISGPGFGTYSMSKFAVEAYTDVLAAEMQEPGVHVSIVEPGSYKSRIRAKATMHSLGEGYEEGPVSSDDAKEQLARAEERNAALKEPDEVAEAVLHALFADEPKRRYMVTPDAEQADITIRTALGRVVELNADQPYEYSRDDLVALLDELLAEE